MSVTLRSGEALGALTATILGVYTASPGRGPSSTRTRGNCDEVRVSWVERGEARRKSPRERVIAGTPRGLDHEPVRDKEIAQGGQRDDVDVLPGFAGRFFSCMQSEAVAD